MTLNTCKSKFHIKYIYIRSLVSFYIFCENLLHLSVIWRYLMSYRAVLCPFPNGPRLEKVWEAWLLTYYILNSIEIKLANYKLSFRQKDTERVWKATVDLYSCKMVIDKKLGLTPRIVHWIHTITIRLAFLHSILVWWPIMYRRIHLGWLTKVQTITSLYITEALRNTPSDVLDIPSPTTIGSGGERNGDVIGKSP